MDKELFEIMVDDWMADHVGEMGDLVVRDVRYDDDMDCWVADAEGDRACYMLLSYDTENINIEYVGAK